MINHISGGNSFPYIEIGNVDPNTDTGVMVAIHEGEHPLYDVKSRIVDLQKFDQFMNNPSFGKIGDAETNIDIGNLIPSNGTILKSWKIENIQEQSYNIFFTARNGTFTQSLRLKKINGRWLSASQVKNGNGILHEQVDKNFPVGANGKVNWDAA